MSTLSAPSTEAIRLDFESAGRLLTPEEFDAVTDYDELYRYELIHGVLVVRPFAEDAVASMTEELGYVLRAYESEVGRLNPIDATLPWRYVCTRDSRHFVDRVVWCGLGRRPCPALDVPTIAIEFVSAGRRNWQRDYVEKRMEYAEVGVAEYWIIDRFRRTMTVYCSTSGRVSEVVLRGNEVYKTPLLPGFELPLAKLFALADDWK